MKKLYTTLALVFFGMSISFAQAWMTNLEIAQRLAQVQNKMVLMVWEETTNYQYPVFVKDDRGRTIYIDNLFEDEEVSPLIWEYFVPVIVSEYRYADLYEKIKGKRSQIYIDKFNDDSIKIMDVNGNILNVSYFTEDFQNITEIIRLYGLNTQYIAQELKDYKSEKDFYSAYYLASKYLDFALYADTKTRSSIVNLSNIYLQEAVELIKEQEPEDRPSLEQRCELLKIQEYLILKRPKKVIRLLRKLKDEDIYESNKSFVAFLYYTAYMSTDKPEDAEPWKAKISLVNLSKAQKIINLNT
ncbi:hypothetical protein [Winogradskyella ouciana]|uniref:Uncharacterized protein n=1 Tax=Winogradskyella ouciana TaxID=2608631 RepID=A0A7K1GCJ9_9FLAO|nr:hypothetical protein [Winogradskyella ouciana]MTE26775.1 hypothetical protein [Winogradskyella ouciana]